MRADQPKRTRRERPPEPGGLLTAAQATARLGCSVKTLLGYVASGALRYVSLGHGTKRKRKMFTPADLDQFIFSSQKRKDSPCRLPRPALEIFALRPRDPRLSLFRQYQGHDPAGSGSHRTRPSREGKSGRGRHEGGEDIVAARRCRRALLVTGAAPRIKSEYLEAAFILIEFFGKDKLITDIADDDVRALIAWRRGHRVVYRGRKPEDCALIAPATVNLTIMQLKGLFATLRPRVAEPEWRKLWLKVGRSTRASLWATKASSSKPRCATTTRRYSPSLWPPACGRTSVCCAGRKSIGARGKYANRQGQSAVTVPIFDKVREILWPLRGHHPELVFTFVATRTHRTWVKGRRYPVTIAGLRAHWHRLRKVAGVTDFRYHDIRHDVATKALRETGNLRLVSRMLNHRDIRSTLRYAHVLDEEVADGFERLAQARRKKSPTNSQRVLRRVK